MKVTASKVKQNNPIAGVVAFVLALLIVSPLVYCLLTSFLTEQEIFQLKVFPTAFYGGNYAKALDQAPLFTFILNSVIVSCSCMALQLMTGSMAGYAFGCLKFKGQTRSSKSPRDDDDPRQRHHHLQLPDRVQLGPAQAALHALAADPALHDQRVLRVQYASGVQVAPSELAEAAEIDGCNSFQYFIRVAMPLTLPSLGAVGIQTFISVWNQYLWPLLVTNSVECRTVQLGIGMLQNADGQAFGTIMAGTTIVMIPSILVFVLGQKTLVSGLTAGAVKG